MIPNVNFFFAFYYDVFKAFMDVVKAFIYFFEATTKKCGKKSVIVTIVMSVDQIHDGKVWRSMLCVRFNHHDKNCCYILGSFIWHLHKFHDKLIFLTPLKRTRAVV